MADSDVLAFIEKIKQGAIDTQSKYGVFASVTIAQAIIESTYGTSYLATTDNNLFGVKIYGNHDPSLTITQGTYATDGAGGYYCHYQSWADSLQDHGYFLVANPRYAEHGVFTATDGYAQARAIANAGYAEATNYGDVLCDEIRYYNLTQYDTGGGGGGGGGGGDKPTPTPHKRSHMPKFLLWG